VKLTKSQIKELIRHSIRELTSEREDVTESKKRRFTVKEVRMWMKKLEENRYKKVYNSDARRVAWMVNNEGVELSEMPKSMSKKWTKAQYGRERYLATEFLKSKSEQMNERKLTEKVKYKKDKKIGGEWYTKQGTHKHQMKANIIAKREFGRYYDAKVVKEKGGYTIYVKPLKEGKLTSEQKLRQTIREIIKEQLNEDYKNSEWEVYVKDEKGKEKIVKKAKSKRAATILYNKIIKSDDYYEVGMKVVKEENLKEKLNLGGAYEKMLDKHNDKTAQGALSLVRNKIMKDYKVGEVRKGTKVTRRLVATLINNGMKEIRNKAKSPSLKKAFQKIIDIREKELKKMKEEKVNEAYRSQSIFFDKKDKSKLEKLLKKNKGKFPFNPSGESVVNWSVNDKGSKGLEWSGIPKAKYNKAVEFFMKNKLNPRG